MLWGNMENCNLGAEDCKERNAMDFNKDMDKLIEIVNEGLEETPYRVTPTLEIQLIKWLGAHDKALIEICRDIALKAVLKGGQQ